MPQSRRAFVFGAGAAACGWAAMGSVLGAGERAFGAAADGAAPNSSWPGFPFQDPVIVREFVGACHGNLAKVQDLVARHPAIACASVDWGFGDWESGLGAASHVGNEAIARLLLDHGARLDIFAATMLGMSDVVRAMLAAQPTLISTPGPHGIGLVAHAAAGKREELRVYLEGLAGPQTPRQVVDEQGSKPYVGTYRSAEGQEVVVSMARAGMVVRGGGGFDRILNRSGDHAFFPVGAPKVRITFSMKDERAERIEIVDDEWFVNAGRADAGAAK